MSALNPIGRGWHLGYQSLKIVLRDKTLLLFPLIPITIAIALLLLFRFVLGTDTLFWALFIIDSLQHARYFFLGYLAVATISVFFSCGLVACTRITIDERDSNLLDGMQASMRRVHWLILWAILSWTVGPLLNLLDQWRFTSHWVRRITRASWSQISYFLLPVLVSERVTLFGAIRRSIETTTGRWGDGAVPHTGLLWFLWLVNLPTVALVLYGMYLEGPWPKTLTFVVLLMVYGSIIAYQTLSAVTSVVLYKYATDGTEVPGFDPQRMQQAFARQRMYVLVTEESEIPAAPGAIDVSAELGEPETPLQLDAPQSGLVSTDTEEAVEAGAAPETPSETSTVSEASDDPRP
jgi:hypothetical protein